MLQRDPLPPASRIPDLHVPRAVPITVAAHQSFAVGSKSYCPDIASVSRESSQFLAEGQAPYFDVAIAGPRGHDLAIWGQGHRPDFPGVAPKRRSEEHTSELQSQSNLVCRLLLEKKNQIDHLWNS